MSGWDRYKWLSGILGTLGTTMLIGVVLQVLLANGWHTWLLIPIAVGIAMIAGAIYCGWKYWQGSKETMNRIGTASVESTPLPKTTPSDRDMTPQDLGQIWMINSRVYINHGHIDLEGIMADYRDGTKWAEILQGKCSRCGHPRNESKYAKG